MFKTGLCLSVLVAAVLANQQYPQEQSYAKEGYAAPAYEKPMPYEFGYESDDGYGTKQSRQENQDSYGNTKGSYSYVDAYGLYRTVEYTAGPEGFKANIKTNEPGVEAKDPADVYITAYEPPAQLYRPQYNHQQAAAYSAPATYAPAKPQYSAPQTYAPAKPQYAAPAPAATYAPAKYEQPKSYGESYEAPKSHGAGYLKSYSRRPNEYSAEPAYAAPAKAQYSAPQYSAPQYSAPQYSAPQYAAPQPSYAKPAPQYAPAKPQYAPAPAPKYAPANKYAVAPAYPAPQRHYAAPAPAPKYETKYVEAPEYSQNASPYQEQEPQEQQAYQQVPEYQATANYGQQKQYAQQAVRAAYRRTKKQAYDPAYSGDIDTANSSLKPSVEYADA